MVPLPPDPGPAWTTRRTEKLLVKLGKNYVDPSRIEGIRAMTSFSGDPWSTLLLSGGQTLTVPVGPDAVVERIVAAYNGEDPDE